MKKVKDLYFGEPDAKEYISPSGKAFFEKVFYSGGNVDKIVEQRRFFLVGEKGTGKTSYARYLADRQDKNMCAEVRCVEETDYRAFLQLKQNNGLIISDYEDVWKAILLTAFAQGMQAKKCMPHLSLLGKMKKLNDLLKKMPNLACLPERLISLERVDMSRAEIKSFANAVGTGLGAKIENGASKTTTEAKYVSDLRTYIAALEKVVSELKGINKSYILFIDNADLGLDTVDSAEFLLCVRGLSRAVAYINQSLLTNLCKEDFVVKIMLVIRPDILAKSGLHNLNGYFESNSVLLNWYTTKSEYKKSELYKLTCRLLHGQQSEPDKAIIRENEIWDYYFPFKGSKKTHTNEENPFVEILHYSRQRPRDIVKMLQIAKEQMSEDEEADKFKKESFNVYSREFANYWQGELREWTRFYLNDDEYETFLHFFTSLNKTRFSNTEYLQAYSKFQEWCVEKRKNLPKNLSTTEELLEFLYAADVICYHEDFKGKQPLTHWCYRERSFGTPNPRINQNAKYFEVHPGIAKALNLSLSAKGINTK